MSPDDLLQDFGDKLKIVPHHGATLSLVGSFVLYILGYLAIRFHLTTLGVGTDLMARLISVAVAVGKADHNSATLPVTNGAAALVPPDVTGSPRAPRLVTASPGAISPRRPIEAPRFEGAIGCPRRSHAATGITHTCRVMAELPMVP